MWDGLANMSYENPIFNKFSVKSVKSDPLHLIWTHTQLSIGYSNKMEYITRHDILVLYILISFTNADIHCIIAMTEGTGCLCIYSAFPYVYVEKSYNAVLGFACQVQYYILFK